MELKYGIKQPLRIYEHLSHQNRNRKNANSSVFELMCPTHMLLPFQIIRPASVGSITSIRLVESANPGNVLELINSIQASDIDVIPFDTFDYLVHFGTQNHTANIDPGRYYLQIQDISRTWYSEEITFKEFREDLSDGCAITKITYWDTCDIADIFYRTQSTSGKQYKNILYLDIDVSNPEYEYDEEGDNDAEGNFIPEYKRLGKQYQLERVFPEYMVDALTTLPLHIGPTGTVEVLTDRGYTGEIAEVSVSPEWQGKTSRWALTEILFTTEFVVKVGCCDALEVPITECLRNYTSFVAKIVENSTDYNNYQYTSAGAGGGTVPLVDNDLVLIELLGGGYELKRYNDSPQGYENPILIFLQGDS